MVSLLPEAHLTLCCWTTIILVMRHDA